MVKFPITVSMDIDGPDGNAFAIMGTVRKAMKRFGCSAEDIKEYTDACTSGDYDNLLKVTRETVEFKTGSY